MNTGENRLQTAIEQGKSRVEVLKVMRQILAERLDAAGARDTASVGRLLFDVDKEIEAIENENTPDDGMDAFNDLAKQFNSMQYKLSSAYGSHESQVQPDLW